jgi:flagellar basal body-associated protein FliL
MVDKTTNKADDATTNAGDGTSLRNPTNPISKGTLIMIAAAVIFLIVAGIIFSRFFSAPAGGNQSNSTNTSTRTSP